MKRWELRAYLEDGRCCTCDVPIEMPLDPPWPVEVIKQRLYESYCSIEHEINPKGPRLAPELERVPP